MSTDRLARVIAAPEHRSIDLAATYAADRVREAFVVIDRNDLPGVRHDRASGKHLFGASVLPHRPVAGDVRSNAYELLALAEWLDAHPPVDEKAVRELAAAIDSAFVPEANKALFTAASRDEAARRLVADGWKREVTP